VEQPECQAEVRPDHLGSPRLDGRRYAAASAVLGKKHVLTSKVYLRNSQAAPEEGVPMEWTAVFACEWCGWEGQRIASSGLAALDAALEG